MAEEEEMKALVVIFGILSAVIILCLLAFSFMYESDYRQLKEWDKDTHDNKESSEKDNSKESK